MIIWSLKIPVLYRKWFSNYKVNVELHCEHFARVKNKKNKIIRKKDCFQSNQKTKHLYDNSIILNKWVKPRHWLERGEKLMWQNKETRLLGLTLFIPLFLCRVTYKLVITVVHFEPIFWPPKSCSSIFIFKEK